jgi:O-antigen ligase/polysaccharide polymerase Wzy-like membrane protein
MRRILGSVLLLYTLLICFGDAFKLHRWVPVPLAVLLLGVVAVVWASLLAPRIRLDRSFFRTFDVLLLAYIVDLGLSLLFSGRIELKNINHLVAYTTVVGLYYFFVKFLFAGDATYAHYESRIRTALALSVLLVSTYTILEFIDTNFTHMGITALVRSPDELASYRPLFLVFVRARGFMGEPATLALFLNIFVPMSFVYLRGRLGATPAVLFLLIVAGAFAVTFSAGGLAFIAAGLLVAVGLYVYDRGVVFVPLRWTIVLACLAALIGAVAVQIPNDVWRDMSAKLTLTDPGSGWERMRNWSAAAPIAAEHPFLGTGIGSTSAESGTGVVSLYLTMLKEAGLPSLILIVAFLAAVFREILVLPRRAPYKYAYAASYVAAVCHYAVISDIWYPWIWLLCIFVIGQRHVGRRSPEPFGAAYAS